MRLEEAKAVIKTFKSFALAGLFLITPGCDRDREVVEEPFLSVQGLVADGVTGEGVGDVLVSHNGVTSGQTDSTGYYEVLDGAVLYGVMSFDRQGYEPAVRQLPEDAVRISKYAYRLDVFLERDSGKWED